MASPFALSDGDGQMVEKVVLGSSSILSLSLRLMTSPIAEHVLTYDHVIVRVEKNTSLLWQ